MPKAIKTATCVVEDEDICEEMRGLDVSNSKAPHVPIATRRFQAFALWTEARSATSTPESRAAIEDTLCIFGTAQEQVARFAEFDPKIELALIEAEQKARTKAAAAPPTPSPAKGDATKTRVSRVSMTKTSLDGRPAFVDEQGCYYEPVVLTRAT